MKVFIKIAQISWRNLFRNKRRSFLTISFLMFGSCGLILVGGYFRHVIKVSKEVLIYSYSGHFQLGREGFFKKGKSAPFDYLLPQYQDIQRRLEKIPEVKLTVPRIYFGGTAGHGETNVPALVIGVDPIAEKRVMAAYQPRGGERPTVLVEGRELDPQDPNGIILEEDLKDTLGVAVGGTISLITFKAEGAIEGANLHVRGVYRSTSKEVGANTMKMPLGSAQALLGIPEQVHALSVILWDEIHLQDIQKRVQDYFALGPLPLETIPWERFSQMTRQGDLFLNNLYLNLQIILGFVFIISIANTISMALYERMREYGTMMALGNGRGVIFGSILIEGMFLGILGGIGGVLLSLLTAKIVGSLDIVMPNIPGAAEGVVLYVRFLLEPAMLATIFLITLGSTLLASMIPAYRVSHWPIVRALGYV